MKKRNKIIYWISTIWLCLGMLVTGIVQVMRVKEEVSSMQHLGYPEYFLSIIGVWKILGVIAILLPKFPLIKEWTYAGFFFAMSGAIISHLVIGDPLLELFGPSLLIILTITSWFFRPAEKKLANIN